MKIFNTLSGQKEEFSPTGGEVKMYVCGVTVYDVCHFGHALSYVTFDVMRRYLEYRGCKVKYVQNFTDIDDKIINRAKERGVPWRELVEKYIGKFFTDIDALNIKRATIYPRATESIGKMHEVIQGLMDKGHAYRSDDGSVYFRVKSFPRYGQLTHQDPEEMRNKITMLTEDKEDPLDFALWKAAKPGEPFWPSPWGDGRPGWHIECTAMSMQHLGQTLDIHGGGQDLIFPHHENEIAQSECFSGVHPFVRIWIHNGFLQLGSDKMSKSLGNLVTIKQALERNSSDAIRMFIMSSYYRMPLRYSLEALDAAENGIERLRQAFKAEGKNDGEAVDAEPFKARFIDAMDDDFNAPQALAAVFDLVREINRGAEKGMNIQGAQNMLRELSVALGLTLQQTKKLTSDEESKIEALIARRNEHRKAKEWKKADEIRDELAGMGIAIEDTSRGTVWKTTR